MPCSLTTFVCGVFIRSLRCLGVIILGLLWVLKTSPMGLSLIYFSGHIDAHRDGLKSMLCPSLIHFVFFKKEKHYGTL